MPEIRDGYLCFAPALVDSIAGYDASYFARLAALESGHFWFETRNRLILWALQQYFPQAQSFCEIGCGTGFVLSAIQQTRPDLQLAGSEILIEGLKYAQQRLGAVQLFQMDAQDIPYRNEFDIIGLFDVLEHIENDSGAAAQVFQAVKLGGGILISVPQHPFLWSNFDVFSHHYRRYTRKSMTDLLIKAGFEILFASSFFSSTLPLIMLSRLRNTQSASYDPWQEFNIHPVVNNGLKRALGVETALIRAGVSFSLGSSLLVIARKPQ
jgi:SAM-dependent methyltransferase